MRFKTNVRIFRGKIDMAPLVDVMFILVIFFLISTSYDFQEGFEVDLPVSDAPLVAGHKMVVVIAKGSEEGGKYLVFFNNESRALLDFKFTDFRDGNKGMSLLVFGHDFNCIGFEM